MTGRIAAVTVLVGGLLALSGCGGGGGDGGGGDEESVVQGVRVARVIDVHQTEFALSPKTIRIVRFGYYGIRAINDGQQTHALALDGPGVQKRTKEIAPGESATMLVFFQKAGSYTLSCPLDGHEEKGMKATVKVH